MIEIRMDDGSVFVFKKYEYTEYTITTAYVVVKRADQWIGIFDKKHFISLIVKD